jgi:hypothetical protein
MITFTTVLQGAFSIASKNDLDGQNLLLATVHLNSVFRFSEVGKTIV